MSRSRRNYGATSGLDSRSDLGHGRSSLKFTKPKIKGSAYPYSMTDEEVEDSEEINDIELDDIPIGINVRTRRFVQVTDPYADGKTDRYSFTKLSEKRSAYMEDKDPAVLTMPINIGSSTGDFRSAVRPTGTKRGWSRAPKTDEETPLKYRLTDFLDHEDATIRQFIRKILAKEKIYHE